MARLSITITDELDRRLRETVADTIGFKKGNLQRALEEAIEDWVRKKRTNQKIKR